MARPLPPFEPEFALVAACALFDDARLQRAVPALLARPGFDWERLADLAFYHEVEQVVRVRLGEIAPGAMPPGLVARMQRALMPKAALQAAQATAAVQVTKALAEAGIPSLLIKSVPLSYLLYAPTPELRTSNDIDVVIAPEDLPAADRVLRRIGLERSWPEADPPEAARPMFMQMVNVFNYRGAVFNELVELHCRPTTNPHWLPVPFAELLAASVDVDTPQGRLRALDGPLNAFYLCQHALYHLGFRLKWFGDVARAARRGGAGGCAAYIAQYPRPLPPRPGLCADEILHALGEGVEQAAAGERGTLLASADAAHFVTRLAQSEDIPPGRSLSLLSVELGYHALVMRHLPGWRGKAHQMLIALSDPRDALTLRLGPGFAFVYWLAGPVLSLSRFLSRRGQGRMKPAGS